MGAGETAALIREHILRKYAPNADSLLRGASAARRNARAARLAQRLVLPLSSLPPVILVPGHKPNQEVKCLMVGKRDMSTPVMNPGQFVPGLAPHR